MPVPPQLLQALAAGAFDQRLGDPHHPEHRLAELRKPARQAAAAARGTEVLSGKITGPGFKAARAAAQAQGGGSAGNNGG